MILTIDQTGQIQMIAGHGPDLSGCGSAIKRRASHIEPCNWWLRLAFHIVRACVRDESRLAAWTRGWRCLWRARIFGGPTLGPFAVRQDGIDAEVEWLEANVLGGLDCG